ncbi:MAG: copper chaperone CopZ [Bacillota bacterium]
MAKEITNLTVEGMSCQHCVNSITKAVGSLRGVAEVNVDLKGKKVTVGYDPQAVTLQNIKDTIENQGYEVK